MDEIIGKMGPHDLGVEPGSKIYTVEGEILPLEELYKNQVFFRKMCNSIVEINHVFLRSNVFFHLLKVLKLLLQIQSDYEKLIHPQYHVIR